RRCAARRTRRLIEPNARVQAGLHYGGHRELLRMIGLQMGRDDADLPLELLQRDTREDTRTLDATAPGNAVIPVQGPQQCGFARTVVSVNDPAVARMDVEGEVCEHPLPLEVHGCTCESDQRSAGATPYCRLCRCGDPLPSVQPFAQRRIAQGATIHHVPL